MKVEMRNHICNGTPSVNYELLFQIFHEPQTKPISTILQSTTTVAYIRELAMIHVALSGLRDSELDAKIGWAKIQNKIKPFLPTLC